jgi:xylulokinase
MALLLGLDAGTTNFKAALFHPDGRLVASHSQEYQLDTPAVDHVEFDPEAYWRICCQVIRAVIAKSATRPADIAALAIACQGETMICVDGDGHSLGKAIVWLDNRAGPEADILSGELSRDRVYQATGQPDIVATWPAAKILWLKRHAPDIFRRTSHFMLLEDFLILRLTGRYTGERSLYSSSLLLDLRTGQYWPEMLDLLGIDTARLPGLADSAVAVGQVCASACSMTGLDAATMVVTGALDQAAGMVGSGNTGTGMVTESTGTCLAVCANLGGHFAPRSGERIPLHHGPHSQSFYAVLWYPTAGLVLRWFRDTLFDPGQQYAQQDAQQPGRHSGSPGRPDDDRYERMIAEAAIAAPGADGLLMIPHFCGSGYPDFDTTRRGSFHGLTLNHTRGHMIRAILESIACLLAQAIAAIEQSGISVTEIRSVGGGSRSSLWNAIKANVTGKLILPVNLPEPTCLGAARLAGLGAGYYPTLAAACHTLRAEGPAIQPDPDTTRIYRQVYQNFIDLSAGGNR